MLRSARRTSRSVPLIRRLRLCARGLISSRIAGTSSTSPLAFAFDIDGVLLRGPSVLPAARRALDFLDGNNPLAVKIPYVLLTNGGGITEAERCEKLTRQLGVTIKPTQLIQAHTVLKGLQKKYADEPVLVLGGRLDHGRRVVESYGYKHVYIPLDILAWKSNIWHLRQLTDIEKALTKAADFSKIAFKAVIVIHDPRDWGLDIQITCDVLRSQQKTFGQEYRGKNELPAPEDAVDLIFCNPDLLWKSDFPLPRFGQGAFKTAFQVIFKEATGAEYPYTQYGKPHAATYDFARDVLRSRIGEVSGVATDPIPEIFMVGDNPESDIAGACAAKWKSVLVHTGVYDPSEGPPSHEPTAHAKDVEEAVHWAFKEATGRSI